MSKAFPENIYQEMFDFYWEAHPVAATAAGIHTYDHHYGQYSEAARKEYLEKLRAYLEQLQNMDLETLSDEQKVDRSLLLAHFSTALYDEEKQQVLYKQPYLYPTEALLGVQGLQINYNLPLDHRVLSIIGRLKDMPRLFDEGMDNLRKMPDQVSQVSVSQALAALENGKQFLEEILPPFSGTVPYYFKDLLESNAMALRAMREFEDFLNKLETHATDNFACGADYFEFLLREKHLLNYTMDELLKIGEDALTHTETQLNEVASELDPDLSWKQHIQQLKNQYPEADELRQYYKKEAERIRDFGLEQDLYTLPDEETLVIMETPIFQRSIMPYSGYVSPAPFDEQQTGYFWVTPMQDSMSEDERLHRLRAHSIYDVILTTIHHAYPGQHLLFVRANEHASKIRRGFPDMFFASGWPLYCEEMLYTEELYTDLETRLFQLKDQLWRECRLILDVRLHTGDISYQEAVQMLVDKVGLDPLSAAGEVKRYILHPTVGCGYLLGKREIVRLRQEVEDITGEDFSLKDFHDTLLSLGILPFSLLRKQVLDRYTSA